jgi:hypothetical protein
MRVLQFLLVVNGLAARCVLAHAHEKDHRPDQPGCFIPEQISKRIVELAER